MKNLVKKLFSRVLASLARDIIRKYKPQVVMITGSVGKTSTKDAVAAVLSKKFFVRKSDKSYNSDLGVPFTIIGANNPWSNPFAWLNVFRKGLAQLWMPITYPTLLVLEVGADQPGDLAGILKIVKPTAVVVTLLPSVPVHVEAFADPSAVRDEEFSPAQALAPGAPLIICADDHYALEKAHEAGNEFISYGVSEEATVQIKDISTWEEESLIVGMKAELQVKNTSSNVDKVATFPIKVRGAFGRAQLFAPSAAIAAGIAFGMTAAEALDGLNEYVSPPGRARIFVGKRNTLLIDDTYNSSPAAAEEILRSLEMFTTARRRVAVLGDMLELGEYSEAEHIRIGHIAAQYAQMLVTVGKRAKAMGDAALEDGMEMEKITHFETSQEAAAHIEGMLEDGDIVLIKGSQTGVRMERIVRPLLANFADSTELVRQDKEWQKRA
jgi:UDP-N-acetylmuramoyl-tripeptide--D-alanyl-D-alanine ligase